MTNDQTGGKKNIRIKNNRMKRLTSGNKWNKLFKQAVKEEESDQDEEETKTEQDDLDNHHDEEITTKVEREDISGQSVWNYVRKN